MDKIALKKLIKKAKRGDRQAFEDLYHVFIKSIFYHTSNLLDDKAEIEDAVQEIVYKMYRGICELKQAESFSSWMHRIITTTCINRNIKNGRMANSFKLEDYSENLREGSDDAIPEAFAMKQNQNEILAEVIASLPRARRQAVIMYYYDDMSYKEIAQALDVTVSTVSTNIMKAKRTIEEELKKRSGDEPGNSDYAITAFLAFDAARLFPESVLNHFCANFSIALDPVTVAQHIIGKTLALKMGALGVGAVCTVSAALYAHSGAGYETEVREYQTDPYVPDAVIELAGNDCPDGHVNPYEATLHLRDGEGRVIEWDIAFAGDPANVVRQGTGTHITSDLQDLPAGLYRIDWLVENPEGNRASVMRDILILDGPVPPGAYE